MPAAPRRFVVLIAALALTASIPASASAEFHGVKETAKSTFTLLPDERVVRAETTITVVNQKKPTKSRGPCKNAPRRKCTTTTTYYIEGWAPLHIPPDAANLDIGGRGVESFYITGNAAGSTYAVHFPRLGYKKKQVIDVSYDLPDAGPDADGRTRITDAYAHFCWRGQEGDANTTKAVLPPGWQPTTTGAKTTVSSGPAATTVTVPNKKLPAATTLCSDAYIPEAMERNYTVAPSGQLVSFDRWPDDPDWTSDLSTLIADELPALESTIGSPMPYPALLIREVARSNNFGRPADFSPTTGQLLLDEDIDFAAAPLATLARTWFDDGSIGDPWLAEGLVLWSGLAATDFACPEPDEVLNAEPDQLLGAETPSLLDWRVNDESEGDAMLPVYQVSAACSIIEEIADLVGPERMADVITSVRTGTPRYGDAPRLAGATPRAADWTDWLDAADELGMIPAEQVDLQLAERALINYGIATPEQLAGRFSARTLYHDTLDTMDGATLPAYVDQLMEAWSFDEAVPAILEAKRLYDVIADHPTIPEDMRDTLLHVFESAQAAEGLGVLEGAVLSWEPPAEPAPTDA